MSDPRTRPVALRQDGPDALLVEWADGTRSRLPVRELRLACACATCVDEWTGEARLDPKGVPADVRPVRIRTVGRYGIQVEWSDGHTTGIYPFGRLRELGDRGR